MIDSDNKIIVSIICNAYNHEKYIRDALDGFVMQKTNFPFEILIHDDASTDKTADIIREYEQKYPELIKPIYQTENQYSKKEGTVSKIQFGRVSGKYIAICEGDDYWTDSLKLQKQFDAMEAHPEVDICTHATTSIHAVTGEVTGYVEPDEKDAILSAEQVIAGGGAYVATNSIFYRADLSKTDNMPQFRKKCKIDYTLQIHGSLRGGMLYLKDNMSVYRVGNSNSWSGRTYKNKDEWYKHSIYMINLLKEMNEELKYKYNKEIQLMIKNYWTDICSITNNYWEAKKNNYEKQYISYKTMRFKEAINRKFPYIRKIKRRIINGE